MFAQSSFVNRPRTNIKVDKNILTFILNQIVSLFHLQFETTKTMRLTLSWSLVMLVIMALVGVLAGQPRFAGQPLHRFSRLAMVLQDRNGRFIVG